MNATHFSNLLSIQNFVGEKDCFGFLFNCYNFFCKQKILLRTPYMKKVSDPTFLRPKFDVRRPSL